MLNLFAGIATLFLVSFKVTLIIGHVLTNGRWFPWMKHILGDIREPNVKEYFEADKINRQDSK